MNERITKAINDPTASIKQAAAVQADDVAKERVTKFAVDHLKDYIDKLLPAYLKENDVAFVDSISEIKEDVSTLDVRVKNLMTQLT